MSPKKPVRTNKSGRQKKPATIFRPEDSVGYLLRITSRAFQRAFQERIEQDGVTIGMWFYLRALWEKDGVTQRELSQSVETMDPSTGSALAKMERLGLIYRSTNKSDRRKRYIYLTEKAKKMREKLIRHATELNYFVTEELSTREEEILRATLMKIRERLKKDPAFQRVEFGGRSGAIEIGAAARSARSAVRSSRRQGMS